MTNRSFLLWKLGVFRKSRSSLLSQEQLRQLLYWAWFMRLNHVNTVAEPGFLLGGGAPLKNGIIDRSGKRIRRRKALSQGGGGGVGNPPPPPLAPPLPQESIKLFLQSQVDNRFAKSL